MFNVKFSIQIKNSLKKIKKKNLKLFNMFEKKVFQIINLNKESINHFKNLRKPLNHLKRVHIGSFILTFEVKESLIIFEDFVHHDKAY